MSHDLEGFTKDDFNELVVMLTDELEVEKWEDICRLEERRLRIRPDLFAKLQEQIRDAIIARIGGIYVDLRAACRNVCTAGTEVVFPQDHMALFKLCVASDPAIDATVSDTIVNCQVNVQVTTRMLQNFGLNVQIEQMLNEVVANPVFPNVTDAHDLLYPQDRSQFRPEVVEALSLVVIHYLGYGYDNFPKFEDQTHRRGLYTMYELNRATEGMYRAHRELYSDGKLRHFRSMAGVDLSFQLYRARGCLLRALLERRFDVRLEELIPRQPV